MVILVTVEKIFALYDIWHKALVKLRNTIVEAPAKPRRRFFIVTLSREDKLNVFKLSPDTTEVARSAIGSGK